MRHLWPTKEQAKEQGWGPEEQEALKNEGYCQALHRKANGW